MDKTKELIKLLKEHPNHGLVKILNYESTISS